MATGFGIGGRDSPTEVDSAGGTAHATIEEHFAASDWVLVSTRTQSAIAFNTRPLVFHDLESVPRSTEAEGILGPTTSRGTEDSNDSMELDESPNSEGTFGAQVLDTTPIEDEEALGTMISTVTENATPSDWGICDSMDSEERLYPDGNFGSEAQVLDTTPIEDEEAVDTMMSSGTEDTARSDSWIRDSMDSEERLYADGTFDSEAHVLETTPDESTVAGTPDLFGRTRNRIHVHPSRPKALGSKKQAAKSIQQTKRLRFSQYACAERLHAHSASLGRCAVAEGTSSEYYDFAGARIGRPASGCRRSLGFNLHPNDGGGPVAPDLGGQDAMFWNRNSDAAMLANQSHSLSSDVNAAQYHCDVSPPHSDADDVHSPALFLQSHRGAAAAAIASSTPSNAVAPPDCNDPQFPDNDRIAKTLIPSLKKIAAVIYACPPTKRARLQLVFRQISLAGLDILVGKLFETGGLLDNVTQSPTFMKITQKLKTAYGKGHKPLSLWNKFMTCSGQGNKIPWTFKQADGTFGQHRAPEPFWEACLKQEFIFMLDEEYDRNPFLKNQVIDLQKVCTPDWYEELLSVLESTIAAQGVPEVYSGPADIQIDHAYNTVVCPLRGELLPDHVKIVSSYLAEHTADELVEILAPWALCGEFTHEVYPVRFCPDPDQPHRMSQYPERRSDTNLAGSSNYLGKGDFEIIVRAKEQASGEKNDEINRKDADWVDTPARVVSLMNRSPQARPSQKNPSVNDQATSSNAAHSVDVVASKTMSHCSNTNGLNSIEEFELHNRATVLLAEAVNEIDEADPVDRVLSAYSAVMGKFPELFAQLTFAQLESQTKDRPRPLDLGCFKPDLKTTPTAVKLLLENSVRVRGLSEDTLGADSLIPDLTTFPSGVGSDLCWLAKPTILQCLAALQSVTEKLESVRGTAVLNQLSEYELKATRLQNAVAKLKELEISAEKDTPEDYDYALELEATCLEDIFKFNDTLVASAATMREIVEQDEGAFTADISKTVASAVAAIDNNRQKLSEVARVIAGDTDQLERVLESIDTEREFVRSKLASERKNMDCTLEDCARQRKAVMYELDGGLFASLAADLQIRQVEVDAINKFNLSSQDHLHTTSELDALYETTRNRMATYTSARHIVDSTVSSLNHFEISLETLRDDALVAYPATVEPCRSCEKTLLEQSTSLLRVALPRAFAEVKNLSVQISGKTTEINRLKNELKSAYRVGDLVKMRTLQTTVNELEKELFASEIHLQEKKGTFTKRMERARFDKSRDRLMQEYDATTEMIGHDAENLIQAAENILTVDVLDLYVDVPLKISTYKKM